MVDEDEKINQTDEENSENLELLIDWSCYEFKPNFT